MRTATSALAGAAIVCLGWVLWSWKFPVSYSVCDQNYKDCEVIARFDEMRTCESFKTYYNAYCQHTPTTITCEIRRSTISTGICR